MKNIIKLNANNLSFLPKEVMVPKYNRSKIKTGIVHIGVGNFFRAHVAFYTDQLLNQGVTDWGICGIGLLEKDSKMNQALKMQDCYYSLILMEPEGTPKPRIIGSIIEYLFAPEDPEAALEKMADPEVKIVTLTITEGGYNYDSVTDQFNISEPLIQWDLQNAHYPKTVFGYLTQALKRRMDRGIPGLTILSCDNIQHNGDICKKMLITFINEAEPGLEDWVKIHVTFPNCMVDRITPITTTSDINKLKSRFGIADTWPVVCEPFIQWVIEDNFSNGRPEWDRTGVQFVDEVEPYERMKIRLLNTGHSLLGLSGSLLGYNTIDETVRDSVLVKLLRKFMDEEVTPVLGTIEGIDLEKYKESLIQRFANSNIKDHLTRICAESSAKIPKFLLPTIQEQLERSGQVKIGAFIVASWCRYLELADTPGYNFEIQDVMKAELLQAVKASVDEDPLSFLKIKAVFGHLVHSKRFVHTYIEMINNLRNQRVNEFIRELII